MSKQAKEIPCTEVHYKELEKIVASRTAEVRFVERAKVVLACINRKTIELQEGSLAVLAILVYNGGN